MSLSCIFYHNCMGCITRNSWSCCILLGNWLGRDVFKGLCYSWIFSWYHMDNISFESFQLDLWFRADRWWWVFRHCSLLFNSDFLEQMSCSLSHCYNGGSHLNYSFLLDMHHCHYKWLLFNVFGNEWLLSLHYMDGGSWNLHTVCGRLAFNTFLLCMSY